MTMENAERQVVGLSILLQLSRRVREAASAQEIGFIAVNESKQLLSYRQAALWLPGRGIFSVSGIPDPERGAPYIQWLTACCKHWRNAETCAKTAEDLPGELARAWDDWAPRHAALAPVPTGTGNPSGLLICFREEPWQAHEPALLSELAAVYGHGLALHIRRGGFLKRLQRRPLATIIRIAVPVLAVAALFYPVRMSVSAPAEVVAKDPFVVRSPLDTVIDKFYVRPNQPVADGQLLFAFERANLQAKYEVAVKAYEIAAEEYRQAAQTAVADDRFRAELAPRRGTMEEKAAELEYFRRLLEKTEVKAPRPGIAVFAEQSDWVGKNVSVGERVLTIADPSRVELLIRLPIADVIDPILGDEVRFFPAGDPQRALAADVRYAAYNPEISPAGIPCYRLKADFAAAEKPPRIGLSGTARIYGKRVSLGYYLFRRPLTALRQRF